MGRKASAIIASLMPDARRRVREFAAVAAGLAGILLIFVWPVVPRLSDGIITHPGGEPGDHLQVIWDMWWMTRAVAEVANPWFTSMLFAPEGTPLVLHSIVPIQTAFLGAASQWLSVELAYNFGVLACIWLAGLAAYVLCRYVTGTPSASFAGAVAFMLSPFIVSRATAGWFNMLNAWLLPLFTVALLSAIEDDRRRERWPRIRLAIATASLVLTDPLLAVFGANIAVAVFAWQAGRTRALRDTAVRFWRVFWPSFVLVAPFVALVAYYMTAYDFPVDVGRRRLDFLPEPIAYVAPFHPSSAYSPMLASLDLSEVARTDLARTDTAVFLGWFVAPLAIVGFVVGRRVRTIVLAAFLFVLFFVLSWGPGLLWMREVIHIGPFEVRLPFAVWQVIPGLGNIPQSGRYMVIAYMAMAVGVAAATVWLWSKAPTGAGRFAYLLVAALVSADFAFRMDVKPLPQLASGVVDGIVLDPRLRTGLPMHYQTIHQQPLVGGYINRRPEPVIARYRSTPGLRCFFVNPETPDCGRGAMLAGLGAVGVRFVFLDPFDWRTPLLDRYGFVRIHDDRWSVAWRVPDR